MAMSARGWSAGPRCHTHRPRGPPHCRTHRWRFKPQSHRHRSGPSPSHVPAPPLLLCQRTRKAETQQSLRHACADPSRSRASRTGGGEVTTSGQWLQAARTSQARPRPHGPWRSSKANPDPARAGLGCRACRPRWRRSWASCARGGRQRSTAASISRWSCCRPRSVVSSK